MIKEDDKSFKRTTFNQMRVSIHKNKLLFTFIKNKTPNSMPRNTLQFAKLSQNSTSDYEMNVLILVH